MKIKNFFGHLHTINKHRRLVRKHCFKCGLYWRGLTHDLSKYTPTEFLNGARYYLGYRSPTVKEREAKGYSEAWMHHKGRNRHHVEYWRDFNMETRRYEPVIMPKQFVVESLCDRIAACKVYMKENYKDDEPLKYFLNKDKTLEMHEKTRKDLTYLLTMLKDKGEKATFKYIKKNFKKDDFLK